MEEKEETLLIKALDNGWHYDTVRKKWYKFELTNRKMPVLWKTTDELKEFFNNDNS